MSTLPTGSDREHWRRHRAARVVARCARDAEDRDELLAMLGLTAAEARFPPRSADDAGRVPAPRSASQSERDLATFLLTALTQDLR